MAIFKLGFQASTQQHVDVSIDYDEFKIDKGKSRELNFDVQGVMQFGAHVSTQTDSIRITEFIKGNGGIELLITKNGKIYRFLIRNHEIPILPYN
jgi:hypothetical protein